MKVSIYNTLTEKIEELIPLEDNLLKVYSCGPTVYDHAHIGNLRYFVFVDILMRTLKNAGYTVYQVMNITDIDDKVIKRSFELNIPFRELSRKYEKLFFEDLKKLKCKIPDKTPRATEEIPTMVKIIESLLKKGIAYKKNGSIYYDISKFKDYGKLSKIDKEQLKAGARVDVDSYDKENPRDFALWKAVKENEPSFDTSVGIGRPGWHIECSAISYKYLGEHFDIHTGGIDLIFPHHENEIAQSEVFCGHKTVNYWVHSEHLFVDGRKMSKSLGNFYTLRSLEEKGYSIDAIRYLFLSAHFKTQLNFTFKSLKNAENTVNNINDFVNRILDAKDGDIDITSQVKKYEEKFFEFLYNNIDITKSLSYMFEIINLANNKGIDNLSKNSLEVIIASFKSFNEIIDVITFESTEIPKKIKELAEKRWQLRKEKNFESADKLRVEIKTKGFVIEDKKDSYIIRKDH